MVSFLLIISFLLHLLSLAAILQLLRKLQKLEGDHQTLDVAAILESSLEEIKAENLRLQQLLEDKERDTERKREEQSPAPSPHPIEEKQSTEAAESKEDIEHLLGTSPGYKVEASLESRVMQLHQEGYSIEEIAKKLDCGKTEAELIIKMYSK